MLEWYASINCFGCILNLICYGYIDECMINVSSQFPFYNLNYDQHKANVLDMPMNVILNILGIKELRQAFLAMNDATIALFHVRLMVYASMQYNWLLHV